MTAAHDGWPSVGYGAVKIILRKERRRVKIPMSKLLLESLAEICKKYPMEPKVLVVPSFSAGHALWRSYGLAGYGALNLHVNTVTSMVEERMAPGLYREGLFLAPNVVADRVMYEVMQKLSGRGALTYFNALEITPGIAAAVRAAVQELKESGYVPREVPPEKMVSTAKGEDLRETFAAYQESLLGKALVDRADLLRKGLDSYHERFIRPAVFLLPTNLPITPLEREFLSRLLQDHTWISLPMAEVDGLKAPGDYLFEHFPADQEGPRPRSHLSSLYRISRSENSNPEEGLPQLTFFHAYGESSEVREVLRQIRREKVNLEEVAVYYTSREPYGQLFYEEAQRWGIPVTFGEGAAPGNFSPGELFFALAEWIKSDFQVSLLHRLIAGNSFKADRQEGGPSKIALARKLRSAGIGWGRERYESWIEQAAAEAVDTGAAVIEAEEGTFEPKEHESRVPGGKPPTPIGLHNLLKELLEAVPVPDGDGLIDPSSLARGLADIIENRSRLVGEGDSQAYRALLEILSLVAEAPLEKTGLEEAVTWLEDVVASLQFGASLPEPGSLHVDSYRGGIWNPRRRVFLVGLEARKFPGQAKEDPILLDLEREELGRDLHKHRFRPVENLFEMVQLLAARGSDSYRLTFSFSSFDTAENREESPSPLLLQVYRLLSGEPTADYSTFQERLGPAKGFVPFATEEALGDAEWWLERIVRQGPVRNLDDLVWRCYPYLRRGVWAREHRYSHHLTEFDGAIFPGEPWWTDERFFSASSLEELAQCPYRYFLNYVLGISPPEDLEYHPDKWLDAMSRGTLLHRIFEDFYLELLDRRELPSYHKHLELLESIVSRRIEEIKEAIPPPHRAVYRHEYREILKSCRLFLSSEADNAPWSTPVYLELVFGLGKSRTGPGKMGVIPPVEIELPSGRNLRIRGKIDRVDRLQEDGSYAVLDYKTGSTYAFGPGDKFRGGRQLQHALYGLALEKILTAEDGAGPPPQISQCGYLFPTLKGEGQRLMRSYRECREPLLEILDTLTEVFNRGAMTVTPRPDEDCSFCDYTDICEPDIFGEAMQKKAQNGAGEPLDSFYRVRQME